VKKILIPLLLLAFSVASAQDTLTIMYYNILNYVPGNSANTANLKNIVHYVNPDIFAVNEISDDTSAKHILQYVMNIDSTYHYKKADFVNGPDTDDMLFFNSDKLSLISHDTIQTALRLINEYLLYYNDTTYLSLHDTVYFDVYIAHLKSSTGTTNEQDRLNEVLKFKNYLTSHTFHNNVFFGGDMNFYSNTEPALTELQTAGTYKMNDPLDSIGSWHDNPLYAHIHTQSTRIRAFGGGATGGLDDRFDFIFTSNDVISGGSQLKYIPGTYATFGNDGHHLNDSLTALPLDPDIPDSVTYSLYNQSDHLPVVMKTYLNFDASVPESNVQNDNSIFNIYPNPASDMIKISSSISDSNYKLEIFTIDGQKKNSYELTNDFANQKSISLKNFQSGIYFIRILTQGKAFSKRLVIIQ
jgi:hypothetical protein